MPETLGFSAPIAGRRSGSLLRSAAHLGKGQTEEAERCLSNAIEIARSQGARFLELRAATDPARLWAEQGEGQKARDLLASLYGWFTEGFDTPDLIEANELLDELQSGVSIPSLAYPSGTSNSAAGDSTITD